MGVWAIEVECIPEDVLKEMTYIFRSKIPEEIWPTPNL